MIQKIRGIVIKETPYGDTSKIINIMTLDYGIIGIMCKGAKSMKSKLRALTTRFTYGDFHMYFKEDKLSTLIAVDVVDDLVNIKTDITLIAYLNYITEIVSQVIKQNDSKEIYNLYIEGVLKINEGLNPKIITNIIEIKLLDYLGVGLNLSSCNRCGDTKNIVTIDPDVGGYICHKCMRDEKIVHPKTIQMLRMYYYVELSSITKIDISDDISREISYFLSKYYERYTGIYTNSKDFLEKVS